MTMHIGAPAKPVVSVGDEVKVGQLIGEAGGFVSSPVYTGVSGKVKAIDTFTTLVGQKTTAVTIASDGLQTAFEGIAPPTVTNLAEFLEAVRNSGVVGLGGAGFPTAVKLTVKELGQIEYILINGAECEPYITSDTRTMLDDTPAVKGGIELLKTYMKTKKIVVAIEANKPEAIKTMKQALSGLDGVEVATLPSVYPQGGEKVLIYSITGRVVPEGKLPLDVGVVVLNVTTLAAIYKYVTTGMPLTEKMPDDRRLRRKKTEECRRAHRHAGPRLVRVLRRRGRRGEDPFRRTDDGHRRTRRVRARFEKHQRRAGFR